jgi:hypothetical protein
MATINRQEISAALERLGQLAVARGLQIELVRVGGAVAHRPDCQRTAPMPAV